MSERKQSDFDAHFADIVAEFGDHVVDPGNWPAQERIDEDDDFYALYLQARKDQLNREAAQRAFIGQVGVEEGTETPDSRPTMDSLRRAEKAHLDDLTLQNEDTIEIPLITDSTEVTISEPSVEPPIYSFFLDEVFPGASEPF